MKRKMFEVDMTDSFPVNSVGSLTSGGTINIFAGAQYPFIVREQADSSFELISPVYIHGIMDGEATKWEGYEWEDIRLS
jgi:hypothetical protein